MQQTQEQFVVLRCPTTYILVGEGATQMLVCSPQAPWLRSFPSSGLGTLFLEALASFINA